MRLLLVYLGDLGDLGDDLGDDLSDDLGDNLGEELGANVLFSPFWGSW